MIFRELHEHINNAVKKKRFSPVLLFWPHYLTKLVAWAMNFVFELHGHHINEFVFLSQLCRSRDGEFVNLSLFCMSTCVSYAFQTINFNFILNKLTPKIVTFALIVFKNWKGNRLTNLTMYEDGQRPAAIGKLSSSGYLKYSLQWNDFKFEWNCVCKNEDHKYVCFE